MDLLPINPAWLNRTLVVLYLVYRPVRKMVLREFLSGIEFVDVQTYTNHRGAGLPSFHVLCNCRIQYGCHQSCFGKLTFLFFGVESNVMPLNLLFFCVELIFELFCSIWNVTDLERSCSRSFFVHQRPWAQLRYLKMLTSWDVSHFVAGFHRVKCLLFHDRM